MVLGQRRGLSIGGLLSAFVDRSTLCHGFLVELPLQKELPSARHRDKLLRGGKDPLELGVKGQPFAELLDMLNMPVGHEREGAHAWRLMLWVNLISNCNGTCRGESGAPREHSPQRVLGDGVRTTTGPVH